MQSTGKGVREDLPPTAGQIYLLAEDENKSAALLLLLSEANYALQVFTDPEGLTHTLSEQALPEGIDIHTTFANNDRSHVAAIAKLQLGLPVPTAICFYCC